MAQSIASNVRGRVFVFALVGFIFIFVLGIAWVFFLRAEFFSIFNIPEPEINIPAWVYIVFPAIFSAISISALLILGMGITRYLSKREKEIKAENERQHFFVADAAHELRTPLTVLRAQIENMDDKQTASALLEDVDRITHIIEQILDKSRFEVLTIDKGETADLSEVCTEVVSYIAPLVIKDGCMIELIGAENPVIVKGNSFAIGQAVKNLISNASRYSARGTMITVEVDSSGKISVRDRGRGVSPEDREAIFERFHRADRRGGGSGLGLAIVKSVIEAHGGKVTLDDAPGGGSIFSIQIAPLKNKQ